MQNSPQRWAVRFAIEGDLRFCSHHDLMRAVERTAIRSQIPLRYSEGFNPHPRLSLACPRPVGVSTKDDLLVLVLDEPLESQALLESLNTQAPEGLLFLQAETFEGKTPPRPTRIRYGLDLDDPTKLLVRQRIEELDKQNEWLVERQDSEKSTRERTTRNFDLHPLVEQLHLEPDRLTFTLVRQGDQWARPGELLGLLGLDKRIDLARLIRLEVQCEN
jgi:radical SAM-linked protein